MDTKYTFLKCWGTWLNWLHSREEEFGLNAAKLFGVDVKASRKAIKTDKLTAFKQEYEHAPQPSNTQYGWVWEPERGKKPAAPIAWLPKPYTMTALVDAVRRGVREVVGDKS